MGAKHSLQFGNSCGLFKQTAGVAYIGQLCINYDVLCSMELSSEGVQTICSISHHCHGMKIVPYFGPK